MLEDIFSLRKIKQLISVELIAFSYIDVLILRFYSFYVFTYFVWIKLQ